MMTIRGMAHAAVEDEKSTSAWDFIRWFVENHPYWSIGILVATIALVAVGLLFGRLKFRLGWPPISLAPKSRDGGPEERDLDSGQSRPGSKDNPAPRVSGEFDAESSRQLWAAASQLYDWIGDHCEHTRPRMECEHVIRADYSTFYRTKHVVKAVEKVVAGVQISCESGDGKADSLRDVGLIVRGRALGNGKRRHLPIPAADLPSKKQWVILFIPPLAAGDEYELEIENAYPESARKLELQNNRDRFGINLEDVIDGVGDFSYSVEVQLEGRFHVELPNGEEAELPDKDGRQRIVRRLGKVDPKKLYCAIRRKKV